MNYRDFPKGMFGTYNNIETNASVNVDIKDFLKSMNELLDLKVRFENLEKEQKLKLETQQTDNNQKLEIQEKVDQQTNDKQEQDLLELLKTTDIGNLSYSSASLTQDTEVRIGSSVIILPNQTTIGILTGTRIKDNNTIKKFTKFNDNSIDNELNLMKSFAETRKELPIIIPSKTSFRFKDSNDLETLNRSKISSIKENTVIRTGGPKVLFFDENNPTRKIYHHSIDDFKVIF
jgi:hypothetical protein